MTNYWDPWPLNGDVEALKQRAAALVAKGQYRLAEVLLR